MIDILLVIAVLVPYVVMIWLQYLASKDMIMISKTIELMSEQIRVLSVHAASMDAKINYWNPYAKRNKGE
jgi:uncharacterized protein YoxC